MTRSEISSFSEIPAPLLSHKGSEERDEENPKIIENFSSCSNEEAPGKKEESLNLYLSPSPQKRQRGFSDLVMFLSPIFHLSPKPRTKFDCTTYIPPVWAVLSTACLLHMIMLAFVKWTQYYSDTGDTNDQFTEYIFSAIVAGIIFDWVAYPIEIYEYSSQVRASGCPYKPPLYLAAFASTTTCSLSGFGSYFYVTSFVGRLANIIWVSDSKIRNAIVLFARNLIGCVVSEIVNTPFRVMKTRYYAGLEETITILTVRNGLSSNFLSGFSQSLVRFMVLQGLKFLYEGSGGELRWWQTASLGVAAEVAAVTISAPLRTCRAVIFASEYQIVSLKQAYHHIIKLHGWDGLFLGLHFSLFRCLLPSFIMSGMCRFLDKHQFGNFPSLPEFLYIIPLLSPVAPPSTK